jgi:hypothetical protein
LVIFFTKVHGAFLRCTGSADFQSVTLAAVLIEAFYVSSQTSPKSTIGRRRGRRKAFFVVRIVVRRKLFLW